MNVPSHHWNSLRTVYAHKWLKHDSVISWYFQYRPRNWIPGSCTLWKMRFESAQIGGRTSLQRPLSDSCHILYFKAIKILFSYSSVFFLHIFGIVINSKLHFKIALVMRLLGPPNFCIARRPCAPRLNVLLTWIKDNWVGFSTDQSVKTLWWCFIGFMRYLCTKGQTNGQTDRQTATLKRLFPNIVTVYTFQLL